MRLRPLTEAECYARCYGGHGSDRFGVVVVRQRSTLQPEQSGERLQELFEERLDTHEAEAA